MKFELLFKTSTRCVGDLLLGFYRHHSLNIIIPVKVLSPDSIIFNFAYLFLGQSIKSKLGVLFFRCYNSVFLWCFFAVCHIMFYSVALLVCWIISWIQSGIFNYFLNFQIFLDSWIQSGLLFLEFIFYVVACSELKSTSVELKVETVFLKCYDSSVILNVFVHYYRS